MATAAVVVLWIAARRAFGAYLALSGVYGKLYGSFGIGVAVLVWIYYSATIFIFGAELAAVVTERINGAPQRPSPAAARSADAPVSLTAGPGPSVEP
jgi:membrane protein